MNPAVVLQVLVGSLMALGITATAVWLLVEDHFRDRERRDEHEPVLGEIEEFLARERRRKGAA